MTTRGRGFGEILKAVDCARASGGSVVCTDEASARRIAVEHGGEVRRSERRGAATGINPDPAPGWFVDFGSALSVVDVKVTLQPSPKVSATFTLESLAKQALAHHPAPVTWQDVLAAAGRLAGARLHLPTTWLVHEPARCVGEAVAASLALDVGGQR